MALIGDIEFDELPGVTLGYHRIDRMQYFTGGGIIVCIMSYKDSTYREREKNHEIARGWTHQQDIRLSVIASEEWWTAGDGAAESIYGIVQAENPKFAACVSDLI